MRPKFNITKILSNISTITNLFGNILRFLKTISDQEYFDILICSIIMNCGLSVT